MLRRFVHGGLLGPARARLALDDFVDLDLKRYAHLPFLDRIWELRVNLTTSDATFVALAEALAAPLVTTDRRLGRAPTKHVTIVTP